MVDHTVRYPDVDIQISEFIKRRWNSHVYKAIVSAGTEEEVAHDGALIHDWLIHDPEVPPVAAVCDGSGGGDGSDGSDGECDRGLQSDRAGTVKGSGNCLHRVRNCFSSRRSCNLL